MEKEKKINSVIKEKLAIMIDLVMHITGSSYCEAYMLIKASKTYKELENNNFCVMYDSPQANLSAIGDELRALGNPLGNLITDKNIAMTMLRMREINMSKQSK